METCKHCNGMGITPDSMLKATCMICRGSGTIPPTMKPRFGISYEGLEEDFSFLGNEEVEFKLFKERHICPDRKPHDHVDNEVTISCSGAGGIGRNTYVTCKLCGCMQEITDYGEW